MWCNVPPHLHIHYQHWEKLQSCKIQQFPVSSLTHNSNFPVCSTSCILKQQTVKSTNATTPWNCLCKWVHWCLYITAVSLHCHFHLLLLLVVLWSSLSVDSTCQLQHGQVLTRHLTHVLFVSSSPVSGLNVRYSISQYPSPITKAPSTWPISTCGLRLSPASSRISTRRIWEHSREN